VLAVGRPWAEQEAGASWTRRTLDRVAPVCLQSARGCGYDGGGSGVNLRHGGRVAAGGGLLVRESTLSPKGSVGGRLRKQRLERESAPTYAGCTHSSASGEVGQGPP